MKKIKLPYTKIKIEGNDNKSVQLKFWISLYSEPKFETRSSRTEKKRKDWHTEIRPSVVWLLKFIISKYLYQILWDPSVLL